MKTENQQRLAYLIDRCLQQQETQAEREALDTYLADPQYKADLDLLLVDAFVAEKELEDLSIDRQEQILHAIKQIDEPPKRISNQRFAYVRWAAVAALVLLLMLPFLREYSNKELGLFYVAKEPAVAAKQTPITKLPDLSDTLIPAVMEPAMLLLADGQRFSLENLQVGVALKKDGMLVDKMADGRIVFAFESNSKDREVRQHAVVTPRGTTIDVLLPDGTQVFLNAGSKLSFPNRFEEAERRVILDGEAYFDVVKMANKQFVVSSGQGRLKQEIRVLGTQFNIAAYADMPLVETTLLEGSIVISVPEQRLQRQLKVNELAILSSAGMEVVKANPNKALAWREQMFYFEDEKLENVMQQIARWYGVDISYDKDIADYKLWAQISKKHKLAEVLTILTKPRNLNFETRGKEVHIFN